MRIFHIKFRLALLFIYLFTLVNTLCTTKLLASDSTKIVMKIDMRDEVGPGLLRLTAKAMEAGEKNGAHFLLIHMNTYGGLVDAADSIRTRILNSKIPSIVFIDNNAASAGALIAISCNRIYMREGASIGAATVVTANAEALPDKYQSYMRSMMRSTAEKRGRDPKIAEAMVDPYVNIPGIVDSGKVLTLTPSEAMKLNFCNGIAEDIDAVLKAEGIHQYTIREYKPSGMDKLISFLINPAISGILILIMMGGIYFELQTPGVGFPLIAAITAAILYFAPLYLEGLAANWEILLFIAGLALLFVEFFVIPGFGVTGVAGLACILFALVSGMIDNVGFNFEPVAGETITQALSTVVISLFGGTILIIAFGKSLLRSHAFSKLVLNDTMRSDEGFVSNKSFQDLVGKSGMTHTVLRPNGKVMIDNELYPASTLGPFIEKGTHVKVIKADALMVWVQPIEA
ncbi:MAG TPA: NfeD family protein [Bacteroidia bacterium]|nr:NfeD family protein [Bacteroidia bacterium]HNT79945.1 NfeD family protein [Bacteroidia bacterium]